MKVKICGITNQEDAMAAVAFGVDALGFIFAESPRRITPETARNLIRTLPPLVMSVGVFVNEAVERINTVTEYCGLDMIQLHGDETPEMCDAFMPRVLKAFQLKDETDLECIAPYRGKVCAILLDTFVKEKRGGTGKTFDWKLAVKAKEFGVPVILSGGLNPQNIAEAVSMVNPFAVDVNSGVEKSPGKKDLVRIRELIKQIHK